MMNKAAIIISTVLNVLLLPVLLFGSVGIVMGLAASGSAFAQFLLFAYYLLLILPVISIIGSWVNYKRGNEKAMSRFMALPWVYLLLYASGLVVLVTGEKQ